MAADHFDRVAIVASSVTDLRPEWSSLQHVDLISRCVGDVLTGSGLHIDDVDFVIDSGSDVLDGRSISNCGFLGAMGAHHKEESRVEEDGLWSMMYAVDKIASGAARVGLVVAYAKCSESSVADYYATLAEPFYQRPLGLDHVIAHGLLANQYLTVTGADVEVFDIVATHAWNAASSNRSLGLDGPVTRADIAESAPAASPLKQLHLSRPVDGAVAVLVATEEVAHRVTPMPVWITGSGSAMDAQMLSERAPARFAAVEAAAARMMRRSGLSGAHVADFVEVSAGSAVGELLVLESLGLAKQGHGVDCYLPDAAPSVNPSGGALPADPIMATGLIRLAEAAERLTGRAGPGRTSGSRALVHGASGLGMQNHCVISLEV
jgi:acetyl-CoA C-acetyltransferase